MTSETTNTKKKPIFCMLILGKHSNDKLATEQNLQSGKKADILKTDTNSVEKKTDFVKKNFKSRLKLQNSQQMIGKRVKEREETEKISFTKFQEKINGLRAL